MVVAIIWTFYLTEYVEKSIKKTIFVGIVSVIGAYAIFILGRRMDMRAKLMPVQASEQQNSSGSNSPNTNINGNNNTVNNTVNMEDPKVKAKLNEIENLIKARGDLDRKTLLKKYSFGYVIFDVDYVDRVVPYETSRFLDNWNIDWTTARLERNGVNHDAVAMTLPHIWQKSGNINFRGIVIEAPMKVGVTASVRLSNEIIAEGKIVAISEDGIVWVVGFRPTSEYEDQKARVHLPN